MKPIEFLKKIIELPSPGTREDAVQKVVRKELGRLCDRVETDIYGDVMGVVNEKAATKILLTAHVDEIGLMVHSIDGKGFVRVRPLGGVRPDALIGQWVDIHTEKGVVAGVVGRTPGPAPKDEIKVLNMWIDIGAKDGKETRKLVRVGDPITMSVGFRKMCGSRVVGRGMDDRAGVVALVEAMRLIKADKRKPKVAVYALSAVQEEGGGHRGVSIVASKVKPHVALATDVCYAKDFPTRDGAVILGGGAVISESLTANRVVNKRLAEAAKAKRISIMPAAEPVSTGTDGDKIASIGEGVATGVVSIPCRYIHSPAEVIDMKDLQSVAKLMAEFVLRLPARPKFVPF